MVSCYLRIARRLWVQLEECADYVRVAWSRASVVLAQAEELGGESSGELFDDPGGGAVQFSAEARLLLAAKLYELGRLSSGEAARLAGKGRVEFLFALGQIGAPMGNLRAEDMDAELGFALNE